MPTRASPAEDLLADLCHDLWLLRTQAGGPSVRLLAGRVRLGKSQVGAIFTGRIRRPPDWRVLHGLVEACYQHARDHGRTHRLSLTSGVEEYWRPRYTMLEHAFSEREPPRRGQATGRPGAKGAGTSSPPGPAPDTIVGRAAELSVLRAAADDARAGRGRLVLVGGEPGIGKTALINAFAAEAGVGTGQVLWGRAAEDDGAPGFWPWTQIVRAWLTHRPDGAGPVELPEELSVLGQISVPAPLEQGAARFQLFDAVTTWLRRVAAERPTVLVLDDLHRADLPSRLLLRFVVRSLGETPLLAVAAYRDPPAPDGSFAQTLAELISEPVSRQIVLAGLNRAGVAQLVERAGRTPVPAGLADQICERTGGNALFVRELISLLSDPARPAQAGVPTSVVAVVRSRVAQLPAAVDETLAAASVLGRQFDVGTLAAVCGGSVGGLLGLLTVAVDAGLIQEVSDRPGRYRFTHLLVRDAVYHQIADANRAELHDRAGTALESGAAGAHVAQLAHHFRHAGAEIAAGAGVDYTVRAAGAALDVLAYADAVGLFEAALQVPLAPARRCEVLLALGDARMRAGDLEAGRATFDQAARAATALDAPELLARAALGFGPLMEFMRGDHAGLDRLTELLEQALHSLPDGDSPLRARLLNHLAGALYLAPPVRQHQAPARWAAVNAEAIAVARRIGDRGLLARALSARCFAGWGSNDLSERTALSSELADLTADLREPGPVLAGRHLQVLNALDSGDIVAVDQSLQVYARRAEKLGQPSFQYWSAVLRSTRALMHGRFDEAEQLCLSAFGLGQRLGSSDLGFADGGLAAQLHAVHFEQGRLPELEAKLTAYVEHLPDAVDPRVGLARIYAATGRLDDARAVFETFARDDFRAVPRDPYWSAALAGLADVCTLLRDRPRADRLYKKLLPFRGRFIVVGHGFGCAGTGDHFLGQLARVAGRWDVAAAHLQAASEAHQRIGMLPALARTRHELAVLARDRTELTTRPGAGDQECPVPSGGRSSAPRM